MKKFFLAFFVPIISFGQMSLEETNHPVIVGGFKKDKSDVELSYFVNGADTSIYFTYNNENYSKDIKSLSFKGGLKDIDDLYKKFHEVLIAEDKKELRIKLNETPVSLLKNNGEFWFWTDAGYFSIKKEKDLKLLFGKKD